MTPSGQDYRGSTADLKAERHATAETDEPIRAVREDDRTESCAIHPLYN